MGKSLVIKNADFSENGIVPDFMQLDWIGASTQEGSYIDSGIIFGNGEPELEDELEVCVTIDSSKLIANPTNGAKSAYSPGIYINNNTCVRAWFLSSSTQAQFSTKPDVSNSSGRSLNYVSVPLSPLTDGLKHVIVINKTGCSYDGVRYNFATESDVEGIDSSAFTNSPLYLDSSSKTSSQGGNTTINGEEDAVKIHSVKYRRNDVLILDAIPVMRREDEAVGFYDRISGNYMFRNDGSTPAYGA